MQMQQLQGLHEIARETQGCKDSCSMSVQVDSQGLNIVIVIPIEQLLE